MTTISLNKGLAAQLKDFLAENPYLTADSVINMAIHKWLSNPQFSADDRSEKAVKKPRLKTDAAKIAHFASIVLFVLRNDGRLPSGKTCNKPIGAMVRSLISQLEKRSDPSHLTQKTLVNLTNICLCLGKSKLAKELAKASEVRWYTGA